MSDQKTSLEIEKLQAEITGLKKRWWIPPVIQATPGLLLVIVTVIVAWSTGILDAKRERVAAENEHLSVKKVQLEQDRAKVAAEVIAIKGTLADLTNQVKHYEDTKRTVREIRSAFPHSTIELIDGERYNVIIRRRPIDAIRSSSAWTKATQQSSAIIQSLRQFPAMESLSILEQGLTNEDLLSIQALAELKCLELYGNVLKEDQFPHLPVLPNVKNLRITWQTITKGGNLAQFRSLETVSFAGTQIHDSELEFLQRSKETLFDVDLSNTEITDKTMLMLKEFPALRTVNVSDSKATKKGIRELAMHPNLFYLGVSRVQMSKGEAEKVPSGHPMLHLVVTDE